MTILYSVVARGSTILCSHQNGDGSFDSVAHSILPNIPTQKDAKTTYTSHNYMFHVVVENGIIFLCASETDVPKRQPYGYLEEIKRQFVSGSLGHRAQFADAGELQRDFAPVMATQMEQFSGAIGNDALSTLQTQVEEVKGVMVRNIEGVLARGERLEDLMDKTTDLEASATTFQNTTRKVHRKMWWKNLKMKLILALVILVILTVIIIIILYSTHVLPPKPGGTTTTTTTTTTAPPAILP